MITSNKVSWGRVALFYAIAIGLVTALSFGLAIVQSGVKDGGQQTVLQLALAFLFMPIPLVAGLIVERRAGRPHLLVHIRRGIEIGWRRVVGYSIVAVTLLYVANIALTGLLGNFFGLAGVGLLVASQDQLINQIVGGAFGVGADTMGGSIPPLPLLYALGLIAGIVAGFTVNGLFAFGEEYGWRGVLMDELAPLGPVRANLITGLLWGIWHAPPILLLGFNYPGGGWLGVAMMCLWLTPFSFILWRSRTYSGSLIAPAVIHGAFNGSAGFYLILVAQRQPLLSAPVGLLGALAACVVAACIWWATARPIPPVNSVPEQPHQDSDGASSR